jgi:RNA polymerase sigma factor (sigma-70 family)
MATGSKNTVIHHLRQIARAHMDAGMTDGELLESFVSRGDEAAFQTLLRRHGPMVLGVCRRVLHSYHDAEDAFQATFLVLVRKASSVKPSNMVANWLHGVAYRTALKARAVLGKRQVREQPLVEVPEPDAGRQELWSDLQAVLDQELCRLPDKYRMPLILSDIQGRSIKEMTRQLGWPQGTVAGRLARARTMLAKRLTRRGVALSGGSITAVMLETEASACIPASLAASTIKVASLFAAGKAVTAGAVSAHVALLTEGVLKSMVLAKLKSVAAVALVMGLLACAGGLLTQYPAEAQQGQIDKAPNGGKRPDSNPGISLATSTQQKSDLDRLLGLWIVTHAGGKPVGDEKAAFMVIGNRACWQTSGDEMQGGLYLDPTSQPKKYDLAASTKTVEGIYSLDGDTLRLCYNLAEQGRRPKQFSHKPESQQVFIVLKREKTVDIRDFRLPDGSKAFPTIVERSDMAPQPPPRFADTPPLPAKVNESRNEAGSRKPVKSPMPQPAVPVGEAAEKGPTIVVLENATLIIERGANMLIRPVKTEKRGVRLEIPGVAIEVPRLRVETEMHVWQVNISKEGLLEMEKSARGKANADAAEMPSARVAKIIVIGNKHTPTPALLKKMAIVPGQVIDYRSLLTAEKNLAAFNATITVLETGDAAFKDILLRVNEESPPPLFPPPRPAPPPPRPLPPPTGHGKV